MQLGIVTSRALIAAALFFTACGKKSTDSKKTPADTGTQTQTGTSTDADANAAAVKIYPGRLISGFDGKNTYKVPVMTVDAQGVTWSLSDPDLATLEPDPSDGTKLMITTKKAGKATLTAKTAKGKGSIEIEVVAYTPEQNAAGKARFEKGPDEDNPGCSDCHHPGGKGGDNTPTDIGQHTDDQIIKTFVEGISAEGKITKVDHTWKVTTLEKKGLMSYLRSQKPKGWPDPAEDERQQNDREDD